MENRVPLEGNTDLPTSFEITVLIEDITKAGSSYFGHLIPNG